MDNQTRNQGRVDDLKNKTRALELFVEAQEEFDKRHYRQPVKLLKEADRIYPNLPGVEPLLAKARAAQRRQDIQRLVTAVVVVAVFIGTTLTVNTYILEPNARQAALNATQTMDMARRIAVNNTSTASAEAVQATRTSAARTLAAQASGTATVEQGIAWANQTATSLVMTQTQDAANQAATSARGTVVKYATDTAEAKTQAYLLRTPTFTPSFTATFTATYTPTATRTFTPTYTLTPTLTPTVTSTYTNTPTMTPTTPNLQLINNAVVHRDHNLGSPVLYYASRGDLYLVLAIWIDPASSTNIWYRVQAADGSVSGWIPNTNTENDKPFNWLGATPQALVTGSPVPSPSPTKPS